ncbi:MAG TPA: hypothetical protein VMH40_09350 [Myxococcaceae bacterium]|nr:hypothetical protein [Myxococcaceae bacterium]
MRASFCLLATAVGLAGCLGSSGYYARDPAVAQSAAPKPTHGSVMTNRRAATVRFSGDDLEDLGGPVIPQASIYAIWWGDPSRFPSDAMSGMDTLLSGVDGSRYLAIVDQYVRQPPARATFVGHLQETSASPDHSPSTEEIVAKVCQVLDEARQVPSPTALYLVFTDGFPDQADFCAWHDGGKCPSGQRIHVAYLPNQATAPQCDPGDLFQCNGFSEATRALANVTAHEMIEMITDPDLNAWVDPSGEEIADKCNFRFGSCVQLGSNRWQVQKQWSNADHGCIQEKASAARVAAAH